MGGGKEEQARTAITDQDGVSTDSTDKLFVTDSSVEVGDLLCEGVVEGLVSGKYTYAGTKGETGFYSTGFVPYTASGIALTQDPELGFLRSVYWNDVPVVDINGYYNFANINLEYVKGEPVGNLPALSSKLPANETVDLTVHRVIGERLYGLSIQGGTAPTVSKSPAWDPANPSMRWSTGLPNTTRIDAVAKTYTILNKECTAIEVKIKVPALWEQIRNDKAPKKHEVDKTPPPVGYGDTKARSIQYWIYWQPVFDERFDGVKSEADSEKIEKIKGTWEGPLAERVTGKLTEPYVRTTKIDLTSAYTSQYGFDGWRIKIIRVTPESLTSYFKMVTYVDSLTEIYGTKLRYPYSSMVYSKFNAEFFTRIPARSYDAKLLKVLIPNNYHPIKKTYGCSDALTMASATEVNCKVEIEAGMKVYFENGAVFSANLTIGAGATNVTLTDKGSIADSLPDYVAADPATGATVEGNNNTSPATTSTNFWDGGFRYTREWTDNPAWCFYDLLTSSRYGLGDHIDKLQVDKWALYEIAQYCDVLVPDGYGSIEPRFTINHIITSREEAYKVLNDMASIFRGLAYYSNGLIYAVQDAYKKPVYQFNNANVTDGNFTYSSSAKKTRHSVALVRYIDRRNLFQPSVEYVENEEAIKRYGIRQLETTALGCTSRGQARRFGLWMLASESQETESLAFSVGQDGGYLKPGDILQVYDQYRTPLKFGGRTNAVLNTSVAPSTLTYENLPVTGNSIIIDNAINFNDKYYKFSLLTPTYYYDTADIGDNLDSSGINQIRRSQIQDLYFYGPHALTVTGYYRSDYNVGGSGVATQIYFHTGLLIDGVDPIGTGNQLDFENYVITGYTNDYVQGNTEVSYSGGCFSGENLIWSIEPNDPTDDEFISGNFSTYRVINVSENDDTSSYNVSALAYSSGKYDDVEGRLTFQSPNVVKPPVWPYLATLGTAGYSALVTVRKAHPNEKVEKEGEPVTFVETARLEKYPTIEIRFPQAGFNYIRDKSTGELAPTAIVGGGTSYLIDPNSANPKAIRYLICVKRDSVTTGDGFEGQTFATVFTGGVSMKYISVPSNTNNFKDYYAPHQFKYLDGDTIETNPYLIEQPDASNPLLHEFLFEFLADEDTSFWVAIFAVNNDIVSENAFIGLIPGSKADTTGLGSMLSETKNNKLSSTDVFSNIAFVTISSLSSEDKEPSTNEEIVELQTTEPSFSWIKGDTRVIYDDLGNRLFIPDPYDDYRITVRKNTDTAASFDPIFIELTGYHSPSDTPNFVLLRDYNDPNMIESLVSNPDASGYTHEGAWIEDKSDPLCEWFKVETSGVIFRNSPENFPLRDFELVVEAHDSAGTTSAGNKVWDNTLRKDSVNHYAEDGNEGWDIFAGTLAVPSGIVFATASLTNAQKKEGTIHLVGDNGFLLAEQGYNRDYPYVASAAIYANGTLNFEMAESKARNGDVILNANQIRDSFSEVAGLVYYFTTGDSTLADQISPKGVVTFNSINVSPTFSIDTENIPSSIGLGNMAIRRKLPYRNDDSPDSTQLGLGIRNTSLVVDTGADEKEILAADYIGTDQIDIVIGTTYIITIIGTTDFTTQFGVVDPVVGTVFLATIAGTISGTGKVQVRYNKGDLVVHGGYVWKALQNVVASAAAPVSGNKWFGYWQTINVSAFRGVALLEGQDPSNFTIKFPAIHDPLVTNIDLSIALFDKLSLSKYFESDGVTPKRETVTTLDGGKSGQRIPLIFTDKKLNLSRMPKDLLLETKWTQTGGTLDDKIFTTPGDSIHLKELSVLSQLDGAGSYKLWFDFEIQPETDFDEDGVYVGSRYAYTVDGENTVFLHRGFKSKNISTVEILNNESFAEDSPYWLKPTATQFKGIDSLKIPEFVYLKIHFNEPIDPTKYWINADYNQTAGGDDVYRSVKITNSKQIDINPNIRDYVMEQSNPHPNCFLMEKNERYATFKIAPLWSRPIPYYAQPSHIPHTAKAYYTQHVYFQITTPEGFDGKREENCTSPLWNSEGTDQDVSNWNKSAAAGSQFFADWWTYSTSEIGDEFGTTYFPQSNPWDDDDFSQPAETIIYGDNIRIYVWYWLNVIDILTGHVLSDNLGRKLNGITIKAAEPELAQTGRYITFYKNQTDNPTIFNGGSMHAIGVPSVVGKKELGYAYNSTPALENYAWELNQEKTATNENKKEKVIHNIKIQGGLLISDEYSAPVLP